jgi:hypothetical protein
MACKPCSDYCTSLGDTLTLELNKMSVCATVTAVPLAIVLYDRLVLISFSLAFRFSRTLG